MAVDTDILPERYRSPQLVGRGGMGEIYRATDTTLGRAVAVKLLAERYSQDDAVRDRFTREALTAARLSGDPHTVTIFDVGEWNDRPFIVMEYLGGGSLEDRLRSDGPEPPAQALAWLEQAAAALDAAHANGVVHRDVKPANLLLDRNGYVHAADFGIASAAGLDSLTMTGTILGTAGYLSPEQAQGDRATPASDRYALAVVAFELLTGARPFQSESATAEAAAHVHAEVPSVCIRQENLPCELDPVFERALAKDPGARYPSCAEFVAALRQALSEAAGNTRALEPVARASRPLPLRQRTLWPVGLALAALLLAGGIAAAILLTSGGGAKSQARPAPPRTIVKKVTLPGTTVEKQVTVHAAAPATTDASSSSGAGATTAAQPPSGGGSVSEGIRLTDQATGLMRGGRYDQALPLAQQALSMLRGSGQTYEGYANFDVGKSLAELGRCSEALPYLNRREQLLGSNPEVTAAKRKCGGG